MKSPTRYGWRDLSFDLPGGLTDESVLTFYARRGDDVAFNVTLSRGPLAGSFDAHLATAADDLRRSLPGYRLVEQSSRKVASLDARVLEHTATSPDGQTLRQLQAYVAHGREVLLVTATGREDERAALVEAFEHILTSLRVG